MHLCKYIFFFNEIARVNVVTYDYTKIIIGKDLIKNFDVPHDIIHSASCKREKTHIKSNTVNFLPPIEKMFRIS